MSGKRTLYERLCDDYDIINEAWELVSKKPNKDSEGIDEIKLSEFAFNQRKYLSQIRKELRANNYKFDKVRGALLTKDNGKPRPIQIATIKDRVVQKALELLIRKPLDKKHNIFNNPASFAFVKKSEIDEIDAETGVWGAIEQVKEYYNNGYTWAVKSDIQNFFPSIDRTKLFKDYVYPCLNGDSSLNDLLEKSFTVETAQIEELEKSLSKRFGSKYKIKDLFPDNIELGVYQGSILSPLMSNVYLADFDKTLLEEGYNLVRYADDFIILCKTKDDAINAFKRCRELLKAKGLKLHDHSFSVSEKKKTVIAELKHIDFLGLEIVGSKVYPSKASIDKYVIKLEEIAASKASLMRKLNRIEKLVNAWGSTYRRTDHYKDLYKNLDGALKLTVNSSFIKAGLTPKYKMNNRSLRKYGIHFFDNRVVYYRNRWLNSQKS